MRNTAKSITALSPAKINLSLYVMSNRLKNKSSGDYHDIHSVMQALNLFEKVTVSLTENANIILSISDNDGGIPTDQTNTAYKAAVEFFKFNDITHFSVLIEIEKSIPVGAGLAGGSADAAATLVALNALFQTNLTSQQLREIGAKVGADVPFCLSGGTMLATGIGTELTPLPSLGDCYILLAKPALSISTRDAYRLIDSEALHLPQISKAVEQQLENGSLTGVAANLENHFELCLNHKAADAIAVLRKLMLKSGALGARMTGSGSTVFGIFENKADAELCKAALEAALEAELGKTDASLWTCITQPYHGGSRLERK